VLVKDGSMHERMRCEHADGHVARMKRSARLAGQVRDVSENPLANNRGGKFAREQLGAGEETSAMETRILETSINKICSLLAVGFGDAGAEVAPPQRDWRAHVSASTSQRVSEALRGRALALRLTAGPRMYAWCKSHMASTDA